MNGNLDSSLIALMTRRDRRQASLQRFERHPGLFRCHHHGRWKSSSHPRCAWNRRKLARSFEVQSAQFRRSDRKGKESNLDQVSLLILGLGEQQRVAIPISQVAALSEFPRTISNWQPGKRSFSIAKRFSRSSISVLSWGAVERTRRRPNSTSSCIRRINEASASSWIRFSTRSKPLWFDLTQCIAWKEGIVRHPGLSDRPHRFAEALGRPARHLESGSHSSLRSSAMLNHQYCSFQLADQCFGVDVKRVQEVIRYQDMTEVPLAPSSVCGLINLRGQIVTAVDLRSKLGLPPREAGKLP